MERCGILFCMRYPDDVGFVWLTVARLRDLAASLLPDHDCYIAFPRLTGHSVHHFNSLQPVELDCYDLTEANKAALAQFTRRHGVAAIVYMSALPTTLDLAFLRRLRLLTINTEEDSFVHKLADPPLKRLAKFLVRRVLRRQLHDLHIANSASQGTWLARHAQIPPERLIVIPNGVDCTRFVPLPPGQSPSLDPHQRWVICASQARAEKRVDLILRCAARICAETDMQDVRFLYVGDGEMLPRWRDLARDLGLETRFHFAGQQSDLLPYYQASCLMVHAAERESFGLVIAEAMACGLPVVASAAAGPRDIIEHGVTGSLVAIEDEEAFCASVAFYLRNAGLARVHGLAGRRRVEALFSIHRQAQDLAAAIKQTVEKARPAA